VSSSARVPQVLDATETSSKRMSIGRAISLLCSVFLAAGVLAIVPFVATGPASASTTYTPVASSSVDNTPASGTTTTLAAPTGGSAGDAIVMSVRASGVTSPNSISSVSGGGVPASGSGAWTLFTNAHLSDSTNGIEEELWFGTLNAASGGNITVTYASSIGGDHVELAAEIFSSSLGPSAVFTQDQSQISESATSTVSFPSLTTTTTPEIYTGFAWVTCSGTPGTGSGWTETALPSTTDLFVYNPGISAGANAAPSGTNTTSGSCTTANSDAVGGSLFASGASPAVTGVSPAAGPQAGGTSVTITGAGFDSTSANTTVDFGANAATSVNVVSSTQVTATSPAGTGTVDVRVTTQVGESPVNSPADQFTYSSGPAVTGVSPGTGPNSGGTAVIITGSGFTGATSVHFGTEAASFTVVSGTSITASSPAEPNDDATVDITVTTPQGTSATSSADQFAYTGTGYWEVAKDGGIFAFNAQFGGSEGGKPLNAPIVGMAADPVIPGAYWMVAADGGVFSFGGAPFYGSTGAIKLNKPIVGMAALSNGQGYYLVASDGGIFAFGADNNTAAPFYGSMGGQHLNQPIVGMAVVPNGNGYYLVAADGGIFAFGATPTSAPFYGSTGAEKLNQPVVGMAVVPNGTGYYLVAADGGIFAFGATPTSAPFYGSTGAEKLNKPVVGMTIDPSTGGYYLVASDGGIFAFNAPFQGSMGGTVLNQPVVGMAAQPVNA